MKDFSSSEAVTAGSAPAFHTLIVPYAQTSRQNRATTLTVVAGLHLALGYLMLSGFAPVLVRRTADPLKLFDLRPVPPPPPETPARKRSPDSRTSGAAAPANRDSKPTELVAPTFPPPIPPPLRAAPDSGADAVPGPGTGGGGLGDGTGSGGRGNGQGAGGAGTFARKISGRIYDRDYPKAAARAGIGGTVWVRYTVRPDGRAIDCGITRSSGSADLDATTCKLVTKRFRYRPGTDPSGRPIASTVEEDHVWVIEPDDGPYREEE